MRQSKPSYESYSKRLCGWCRDRREASEGLCTWCNNELRRKWKEYEAAVNVMIECEHALFNMSFAGAYGIGSSHNVIFGQERHALRNIVDSHMRKTVEYMKDLRARRIASINNFLQKGPGFANTPPVPLYTESSQHPVTSVTQQIDSPKLDDRDNPRDRLRAEILHHWSPEKDNRALMFVNESIHTESFLKLLLKLAPFYSWEDTTRMVNSMIIERIRHGENKQRCHVREDFWNVFEICRDIKYVPTHPAEITCKELESVNCRVYKWGLLKDGYDHGPNAETQGVCAEPCPSCEAEQAPSAIVFTYQYRNRCRNLISARGVGVGVGDVLADEEYEGTTIDRSNTQSVEGPGPGPGHTLATGNHRPYY